MANTPFLNRIHKASLLQAVTHAEKHVTPLSRKLARKIDTLEAANRKLDDRDV